jgi:hypothetical protein
MLALRWVGIKVAWIVFKGKQKSCNWKKEYNYEEENSAYKISDYISQWGERNMSANCTKLGPVMQLRILL